MGGFFVFVKLKYAMSSSVGAVILAGKTVGDTLSHGQQSKALLEIAGKPMVSYILGALHASQHIQHITYVGDISTKLGAPQPDAVVPAGEQMASSMALGLGVALAKGYERILLLTADVPWLTTEAINRFIDNSPDADLVYPIVSKATAEAQFPGQKRTFVKVADGAFTGGNLFLLKPACVPRLLSVADKLYRSRKNPVGLAGILGFDVVIKLLLGRISIAELEARASRILGASARVFISQDASIAADVDKLEQLPTELSFPPA